MENMLAKDELNALTNGAFAQSFAMILASEIGDKTFLIAAIMAMRHPRGVVFAGAFGSLVVMSCLSAAMGHILPTLIPRQWTQAAAGVLFIVFGLKMLHEGKGMKAGSDHIQEELKEVEEELEEEEAKLDGTGARGENGEVIPLEALESGSRRIGKKREKPSNIREGARNFFSLLFGPVFVQAFILTFLGEWGDRSQIATIALAAAHNLYVVALGTSLGHSCCTAVAVIGGRWLSTKISVKHGESSKSLHYPLTDIHVCTIVTLGGAVLFLIFGLVYSYEAWTQGSASPVSAYS